MLSQSVCDLRVYSVFARLLMSSCGDYVIVTFHGELISLVFFHGINFCKGLGWYVLRLYFGVSVCIQSGSDIYGE